MSGLNSSNTEVPPPVDGGGPEIAPRAELGSGVQTPSGEHGPQGQLGWHVGRAYPTPSVSHAAGDRNRLMGQEGLLEQRREEKHFSPQFDFLLKPGRWLQYSDVNEEVLGPGVWRLGGWPPTCNAPAPQSQAECPQQGCQGSWKAHPHLPQPKPLPTWGRAGDRMGQRRPRGMAVKAL